MQMRQIEIDFDVNKLIELERISFNESANEALRRLLKLPTKQTETPTALAPQGKAWSGKGAVLPHGTQLRMEYNGVEYLGQILDGKWDCGGGRHAGPSPAAASVAKTRDGTSPSLNGWIYWSAKLPGATRWIPISTMRKR